MFIDTTSRTESSFLLQKIRSSHAQQHSSNAAGSRHRGRCSLQSCLSHSKWPLTYHSLSVISEKQLCVTSVLFMRSIFFSQLLTPMSSQAASREIAPPARPNQATFLDEVIMTFSSPMAWLLVVALILTWSGVAIVLFDLLDYKTLAGNWSLLSSVFNQRLISVSHLHKTLHDNFVYFSLKSRVSFHFPQAFRHF